MNFKRLKTMLYKTNECVLKVFRRWQRADNYKSKYQCFNSNYIGKVKMLRIFKQKKHTHE